MKRWVGNLHHGGNTSEKGYNMDEKLELYNKWKSQGWKMKRWKFEITHSLYCAIFENSKAL
jgi:hypothetical protein